MKQGLRQLIKSRLLCHTLLMYGTEYCHIETLMNGFYRRKNMKADLNYYALYLRNYLTEEEDPRANDTEFISQRSDAAAAEYEIRRLEGMNVNQAQECAMSVLLADLYSAEYK